MCGEVLLLFETGGRPSCQELLFAIGVDRREEPGRRS